MREVSEAGLPYLPRPCTTTRRCASGSPPRSPLESQTASPAVVEAIAAMGVPPSLPPKKDGKAATANSQGSSTPSASQPSPHHSRRETSHHHKSHKKDLAEKRKKANDMSPAQKSTGHKVHKDGGCC